MSYYQGVTVSQEPEVYSRGPGDYIYESDARDAARFIAGGLDALAGRRPTRHGVQRGRSVPDVVDELEGPGVDPE